MRAFHLSSSMLGPGSVIEPGNWGRIIRTIGTQHGRWVAESAMEHVRATEFPHLPSRLECAYYVHSLAEAELYRDWHDKLLLIYEVDVVDPNAPQHVADHRGNMPDNRLNLEWCRDYWRGQRLGQHASGNTCLEVLTMSPLRIVARRG